MVNSSDKFLERVWISVLATCALAAITWGQTPTLPKIEPKLLQADLQIARKALEEGHSGIYRYTPKPELDRAFDSANKKLTQPMDALEFLRVLAPVVAEIKCGHTSVRPPKQISESMNQTIALFPFGVAIADGKVVGWFQGRMEFGPRALGNRSIVVDPRRADMKDILNARIKKREPFRPFAPSILEERVGEYFEQTHPSPAMLMVYQVKAEKRSVIPAVTHVDGSGRLQTVSSTDNPLYHQLISDFEKLTGVPIVLNTSFNEDEPIVCNPQEAIECFQRTRMDSLFIGNYLVER